ncbi:ion channel protein [Leifsonia sp. F6_8S_P_1B]|uniref:Ion channel protein n=1 Tax=Leifsonia williamsii TaxID=3035919 RepID=A0ABT8KCE1_9MICO|nr:ion channel protein [Leifsonia williamsii]MDN4615130.1 ion channel protein [Leifsonia williamsii]
MTSTQPELAAPTARTLVLLSLPAVIIGVVSAFALWAVDEVAGLLEDGIWTALPHMLGVDPHSGWWIFLVLTFTGVAVGLVVWLVPGHAGPDSATTELVAAPLRPGIVPSLALAAVLALAGGVSLGPENPIIAINTSLLVALAARLWKAVPTQLVMLMAASGTIGALFGTPVAAALVFTGVVAAVKGGGALWDKLFLPLVAAAAGSLTMTFLAHPHFAIPMPAYTTITGWDLLASVVIGAIATGLGIVGAFLFPLIHRAFHALRHPLLMTMLGGVVLGLLGALGGPITLFKGLDQMGDLVQNRDDYPPGELALIIVVKLAALLIAASSSFRGGRVFPAVFIGAAIGVLAWALIPAIPLQVAVSAGVLGMTLAVTRDGWIALFIGVAVTSNLLVLPILCLAILPAWLMVTRAPEFLIKPAVRPTSPRAAGGAGR